MIMIVREGEVRYYQSGYHDARKLLQVMRK